MAKHVLVAIVCLLALPASVRPKPLRESSRRDCPRAPTTVTGTSALRPIEQRVLSRGSVRSVSARYGPGGAPPASGDRGFRMRSPRHGRARCRSGVEAIGEIAGYRDEVCRDVGAAQDGVVLVGRLIVLGERCCRAPRRSEQRRCRCRKRRSGSCSGDCGAVLGEFAYAHVNVDRATRVPAGQIVLEAHLLATGASLMPRPSPVICSRAGSSDRSYCRCSCRRRRIGALVGVEAVSVRVPDVDGDALSGSPPSSTLIVSSSGRRLRDAGRGLGPRVFARTSERRSIVSTQ